MSDQDLDYAIKKALCALTGEPEEMGVVPPRVFCAQKRVAGMRIRLMKLGGKGVSVSELSRVRHQLEALAVVGMLLLGDDRALEGRDTSARQVKRSREIACPKCLADIGQSCHSPAGHWLKVDHLCRRRQAANERAEQ